jgi:hypothetical protein
MGLPPEDQELMRLPPRIGFIEYPPGNPDALEMAGDDHGRVRHWLDTAHGDLSQSSAHLEDAWTSGDYRDQAMDYSRGATNEAELLGLGQRLAAHACYKYARACASIRAGIDLLRTQATSYDGALIALESRCTSRMITPEVAEEAAVLRDQYTRITDAVATAWELANNAATGAAQDFLTASVYNTVDLKIIAANGEEHPERITELVFGGAALTSLPSTLVRGMSAAEIESQLAGILAATERGGAAVTARGASSVAGRLLLRGLGIGLGTALYIVIDAERLGDGTLTGYLLDNEELTDTITGQVLLDSDGEEVELEPEADGAGARAGGPPCDDVPLGPSGPGEWVPVNRNYSPDRVWWKYEELITGHRRGAEFEHNNVKFEGYTQAGNQHIFTEAKGPHIARLANDATIGPQKIDELANQLVRQLRAIRDVPDARLRWVMAEEGYFDRVKEAALDTGQITEADLARVDEQYVPMDWTFDGCD